MKRLVTFFFVALPLLLACDKPTQKIVIPVPDKPTGQQGGNTDGNNGNNDNNGSGSGNTDTTPATPPSETIVVGYAVSWESTLPDPKLLTHINYAFALIENDFETLKIEKESRLKLMAALKKQNPNLKVLLSVGGWEAGNFSEMAADEKHRKAFAKNCLNAVTKYGLDGIDIDWEYPTSSAAGISSSPNDTDNFTLLMKDLRETLGKDRLLTMASASNAKYVNFKDVVQYLNFVNVMTYDMGYAPKHNAALYKSLFASESCDESVAKHFNAGIPYNKIVLGIPFYGHGEKAKERPSTVMSITRTSSSTGPSTPPSGMRPRWFPMSRTRPGRWSSPTTTPNPWDSRRNTCSRRASPARCTGTSRPMTTASPSETPSPPAW